MNIQQSLNLAAVECDPTSRALDSRVRGNDGRVNASVLDPRVRGNDGARGWRVRLSSAVVGVRLLLVLAAMCVLPGMTAGAQESDRVKVVDEQWGFDGRVVPGQFMPLSILIDNLSEDIVEGEVLLNSVTGGFREVGGISLQPVYLDPHTRRWVHFFPYIGGMTSTWRLAIRTTDNEVIELGEIDQPRSIYSNETGQQTSDQFRRPVVILDPTGTLLREPNNVKHMSAEVFPPYATATHGLAALFLDHVPDWETPRQAALLGWLKSGGQLHLMLDQNRQQLQFSGVLSALNEPFAEFAVESGVVYRHEFQREALPDQIVATASAPSIAKPDEVEDTQYGNPSSLLYRSGQVDDSELFTMLRERTQPDHAWWLIFLLSLMYVGLIFPGCWLLSKRRDLNFLVTYCAIIGVATVFSLFFLFIGRRGYGEETVMHTLAVARAEDATHWHLFGYDNLFVTQGDSYVIEDKDHETLLAAEPNTEGTDARIASGNTAKFEARIPPFSSQAILSNRRLTLPDWKLRIKGVSQAGSELAGLTIGFGSDFPADVVESEPSFLSGLGKNAPVKKFNTVRCYILHGRNVHEAQVNRKTNEITLTASKSKLRKFCSPGDFYGTPGFTMFGMPEVEPVEEDPLDECFRRALPILTNRMLVSDMVLRVEDFQLSPDRIRLFVYAPIPESMNLPTTVPVKREGRVLFVRDMPLAESAADVEPSAVAEP